jgi:hypothetical protein
MMQQPNLHAARGLRAAGLALCLALALAPLPALAQATGAPLNAQPPAGFNGARMVMARTVWQRFVAYLNRDIATGFGFFMISVDGQSSEVKLCPDYACQISTLEQDAALDDCKAANRHQRCVVFAEGRTIKMGYQVLP